jgi:hypothetical protein
MSRSTIAMLLSFAAAVCFVSIGFDIMPSRIAIFTGIVLSMTAGLVWRLPLGRDSHR